MTRAQERLKKPIDVDALLKEKKDAARVEALDDEAIIKKSKKGPKTQDLPRAKGGVAEVARSPQITIK